MKVFAVGNERLIVSPDFGIDVGMVHVKKEQTIVTEDLVNGRERQGQFIAALQVIEAVVEAGHARELAAQRKSPHVAGDQTPCALPRDLEHRQRQIDANR